MQWLGKAPHVTFISATELEEAMKAQGFELLESCTFPKAAEAQFIVARKTLEDFLKVSKNRKLQIL